MDQGTTVEPSGLRGATPLRLLLLALGAVLGGILLSVAFGGAAHADAPDADPAVVSASAADPAPAPSSPSLLGPVIGAVADLTQTVVSPVDRLLTEVVPTPPPAAAPAPPAAAPAVPEAAPQPAAQPSSASASEPTATVPAASLAQALDDTLDLVPLVPQLIGPHAAQILVAPVADLVRPLLPQVAGLLALPAAVIAAVPVLGEPAAPAVAAPAAGSAALASGARGSIASASPPVPTPTGASIPRALDPVAPSAPDHPATGAGLDAVGGQFGGSGLSAPALALGFGFAVLRVGAVTRRRGLTLPSSPVFATDSSPD